MPSFRALACLAAAIALFPAAFVAVSELATLRGAKALHGSAFLTRALGSPRSTASLVRRPVRDTRVAVRPAGFGVALHGSSLGLVDTFRSTSRWRSYAGGASRLTPFGAETITIGPERTEQFLTVDRHVGVRTWRWRLDTTLEPSSSADGQIRFAGHAFHIPPVRILAADGGDLTPQGLRWSLARRIGAWWLELRLDDRSLPSPYLLDPAVDYPTPFYVSSTVGTVTNSQKLLTAAPASIDKTTSVAPAKNATGYQQWQPGVSLNAVTAVPAATPNGRGWVIDAGANNGGTGFPTGTWAFTVKVEIPTGATFIAAASHLAVGMWKGTIAGGAFTSTGTLINPSAGAGDDPVTQNLRPGPGLGPTTITANFTVNKFALAANQTLFNNQTAGIGGNSQANRTLILDTNDGVAKLGHPAADDGLPSNGLSLTSATGAFLSGTTLYFKSNAAGGFTFANAATDSPGTGTTASGVSTVTYPLLSAAN